MRGKPPDNLTKIAEPGYRPRFVGPGTVYSEATDAYYALLESAFPRMDLELYRLSDRQRSEVGLVPAIDEFYPHGTFPVLVQMTPEQRDAASRLWREISKALSASYEAGLKQGKNLLVQLAHGSITIKDFDFPQGGDKPMNRYGIFTAGQAATFYAIAAGCAFLAALNVKLALDERKVGHGRGMWGYIAMAAMWVSVTAAIMGLECHLF